MRPFHSAAVSVAAMVCVATVVATAMAWLALIAISHGKYAAGGEWPK